MFFHVYLPPFLSDIPDYLRRQSLVVSLRKHRRRRGKRNGCAVRLRTTWDYRGGRSVWHIQEVSFHWIRPIVPETIHRPLQMSSYRTRRDGVNAQFLSLTKSGIRSSPQFFFIISILMFSLSSLTNTIFKIVSCGSQLIQEE